MSCFKKDASIFGMSIQKGASSLVASCSMWITKVTCFSVDFSDNLFDARIRTNYGLHYSIASLVVLGGLGFPVFLNLYGYLKELIVRLYHRIIHHKPFIHKVGIITFNTKIVTISTLILLIFGTLAFLVLEKDATMKNMDFGGKFATSIFMSVTPRTAWLLRYS